MIIDEYGEFADATALSTSGTGVANFGDVIDLGLTGRDLGLKPQWLVVQVTTAVTSGGAATVSFQLASDSTATLDTSTQTVHIASAAIPKATLVAGYTLVIPIPAPSPTYERYLGIQQNVATAALTAGAVNAFLTFDPHYWKSYADASN